MPSFAFSDPNPVSTGVDGAEGTRNAMALVNMGWVQHFFWDGRAATLEEQILDPVPHPDEMNLPWAAVGIILGTGLGDLVEHIAIEKEIAFDVIPHFPAATVEYHSGKLIYGTLNAKKVLVFQGRFHLYEGYNFFEITYPVRILHALGVQKLILSNAAGAVNLRFNKGEIMLIEDHINLQGGSPLAEKGTVVLGNRFVDMSAPYCPEMTQKAKAIASEEGITLHKGVYAAVVGPQLETKARRCAYGHYNSLR